MAGGLRHVATKAQRYEEDAIMDFAELTLKCYAGQKRGFFPRTIASFGFPLTVFASFSDYAVDRAKEPPYRRLARGGTSSR